MKIKKCIMMLLIAATASVSVVSPAAAKTRKICPYEDCTATGLHKHGHTKYRTSCYYAVCTKSGCTKTYVHKHRGITYGTCGYHSTGHGHHHGGCHS